MILLGRNPKENKFKKLFNITTEDLSIIVAPTMKIPELKLRIIFNATTKKIKFNSRESTIQRATQ
jgi:hypothetical protein